MKLILLLGYQVFKLIIMKKKIIILALLAFTSLMGAEVFKHSGRAFSVKCAECIKESQKRTLGFKYKLPQELLITKEKMEKYMLNILVKVDIHIGQN